MLRNKFSVRYTSIKALAGTIKNRSISRSGNAVAYYKIFTKLNRLNIKPILFN
jgi:hypothetical protein